MSIPSWTCPTDEEQYKCHVLPVGLANIVPIKQYLVQMREDQGSWRTVATRSHGQPQKYRVEGLRIGAQVEFRMSSINILGRHSFPSDISPTYNVVGKFLFFIILYIVKLGSCSSLLKFLNSTLQVSIQIQKEQS